MQQSDIKLGRRVNVTRAFVSVAWGTEGVIIEDYGSGITIAWDTPDRPYPEGKTPQQVAEMWAVDPACPLRDGFDKESELQYLEVANGH